MLSPGGDLRCAQWRPAAGTANPLSVGRRKGTARRAVGALQPLPGANAPWKSLEIMIPMGNPWEVLNTGSS